METSELLDPETVAAKLGVSVYSVYRLARLRQIEFVKLNRFLRFRREVVTEYINRRTVPPKEEVLQ